MIVSDLKTQTKNTDNKKNSDKLDKETDKFEEDIKKYSNKRK